MADLLFWNVQRLGAGTPVEFSTGVVRVANAQQADFEAYCELTQACVVMTPHNINYRKSNKAQICYGARQYANVALPLPQPIIAPIPTQLPVTRIAPDPAPTAWYTAANYTGGNNFRLLCNRAPADLGVIDGMQVYVLHAPANANKAERCVAYLACHLQNIHGANPWLLIGDLNVEPAQLAASPVTIPNGLGHYIVRTGQRTHQRNRELDYALTNDPGNVHVRRVRANYRFVFSDHFAICASW
ncbi:hypothetical protein AB6A23_13190 [Paenibacillus tarimensis]